MEEETRREVHSPQVVLGLSLFPVFLYAMFRFSIGVILPEIRADLGIDAPQAGLMLSASLLAITSTVGLAGFFADAFGERMVLLSGTALFGLGLILAGLAQDFGFFTLSMVLNGMGGGFLLTPTYSVIFRLMPRSRGFGIGIISGLYNLGGLIGSTLVGLIVESVTWRIAAISLGAIGVVFAGLQLLFLHMPRRLEEKARGISLLKMFSEKNLLIVGVCIFLGDLAFLAFISWAPTFLREDLGMGASQAGFLFGASVGLGGIGVVATGYLFDRMSGKKLSLISGLLSSIFVASFLSQAEANAYAVLLLLLTGLITNTFWNLMSAMAQLAADDRYIGSATGFAQNLGFAGAIVGPSLVGLLEGTYGLRVALVLSVSLPYLLYAISISFFKYGKRF